MHSFSSSPSAIIVIFHHLQHGWSHSRTGLAGSRSASYLSIPVWFAIPIRGGPTMAPAAVTRCFRRNALQGGSVSAARRGEDSLPCQLPSGVQRAASLLAPPGSCSCLAWGVPRPAKDTTLLRLFSEPQSAAAPALLNIHLYQSAAPVYFPFSLWFYCLEPLCFLTTPPSPLLPPAPPLLNYPPFSPHESDFVDTPRASPSQVNNFGCGRWPRFTVSLKQYVALCLGGVGGWRGGAFFLS